MQGIRAKVDYILKHNRIVNVLFRATVSRFFRMIGSFVDMDNKAVLFSGLNGLYNDSPRALYEKMITMPEFRNYRFYWSLEQPDSTEIPGNSIKIKKDTWNYFITALKCKYWIACVNIERSLRFKKEKTIYLNTFHGITVKTAGNDAVGRTGQYDYSNINYVCISGEYERPVYIRAFHLNPECIIETGLPRNDVLYNNSVEEIQILKRKMGIPLNKKVILYAPTWRDSLDGGKSYSIKPPIDFDKWHKELDKDYVLLMRTHPYTNALLGLEFDDFIMDFTNYPSINDLLRVSDIMISDYSSVIFDFAILERPIICFGYDYDMYSKERGLTLDLEKELPGGVLRTEHEVLNAIKYMDYKKQCEEVKKFKNKYITYGGKASETCIRLMFGV